jgi:hypothetical protein
VPRIVAVKNTTEGENHIVSVKGAGGFKPGCRLERDVATQMEAVSRAVIQDFPAFGQLRDQTVGIRIDIQQAIVQLGG